MKRLYYSVLIPIIASVFTITYAEGNCPMHPNAPPELSKNHDCCRYAQVEWEATLARIAPSDESLFQIESSWENQDAESDSLAQLAGRSQLVAMAYTNCEYACPRLLADLKSIENQLAHIPPSKFGITLVTFDPERDTPERFREYAEDNQLDTERWTFLRGNASDILELANLLGVRYKKLPNGEFTHSNIISLLNSKGEIIAQIDGLGADPKPLISALSSKP